MLRKALPALALLLSMIGSAVAQSPVITQPQAVTSLNASGTITTTNTFQQVFAAGGSAPGGAGIRQSCLILNTSADEQWVFFGPLASATKATAVPLPAATSSSISGISCSNGSGGTLQDQVSITGTSADTFFAARQ